MEQAKNTTKLYSDLEINNPFELSEEQLENLYNMIKNVKFYFTDTRDGEQEPFNSTKLKNQKEVIYLIKHYVNAVKGIIEGGYAGSSDVEQEKFDLILENGMLLASFGSSKLPSKSLDEHFKPILESGSDIVTIFVKCSPSQVKNVLKVSNEENLKLIKESVEFLKENSKEVIIDMEHFFDGYKEDSQYSKLCIKAALDAGAKTIVLCDTLGKTPPLKVERIIRELCDEEKSPNIAKDIIGKIGLHLHEDKYYTSESIIRGIATGKVSHIQGNFGYAGERIGNSPLAILFVKLLEEYNIDIFEDSENRDKLWGNLMSTYSQIRKLLTGEFPNKIDGILNPKNFFHAAGMHVGALDKDGNSYSVVAKWVMDILNISNYPGLTNRAGKPNVLFYLEKAFNFNILSKKEQDRIIFEMLDFLKKPDALCYTNALASFLVESYIVKEKNKKEVQEVLNDFFGIGKINGSIKVNKKGKLVFTNVSIEIGDEEYELEQDKNGIFHTFITNLKIHLKNKYKYIDDLELLTYEVGTNESHSDAKVQKRLVFKDKSNHLLFSVLVEDNNDSIASINAIKQAFYYFILCKEGKITHVSDKILELRYQKIDW